MKVGATKYRPAGRNWPAGREFETPDLVHVPGTAIDEFLQELYSVLSSALVPLSRGFVREIFERRNLHVDDSVVTEITTAVCSSNPVRRAIEKGGPLSTSYQRKKYYKEKLKCRETNYLHT